MFNRHKHTHNYEITDTVEMGSDSKDVDPELFLFLSCYNDGCNEQHIVVSLNPYDFDDCVDAYKEFGKLLYRSPSQRKLHNVVGGLRSALFDALTGTAGAEDADADADTDAGTDGA